MTPADGLPELLAARIAAAKGVHSLLVGITGPQGSGKSTLAAKLPDLLAARGLRSVVVGLDDLYLAKADRQRLAEKVHPLFATRGAPGTHDVALGANTFMGLRQPGATRLPRFDKARDDRVDAREWACAEGPFDVILFEGWCVGARPQAEAALAEPVNELERTRDPDGVWREAVNGYLDSTYYYLFGGIGFQVLLRAPGFETVLGWRRQQEHDLIARTGAGQTDAELAAFVQYYERLTRHIDAEMPARADVVVQLGAERQVLDITERAKA
jgi:D-glycerate 3-kinase